MIEEIISMAHRRVLVLEGQGELGGGRGVLGTGRGNVAGRFGPECRGDENLFIGDVGIQFNPTGMNSNFDSALSYRMSPTFA
jgi:hypothetical protein